MKRISLILTCAMIMFVAACKKEPVETAGLSTTIERASNGIILHWTLPVVDKMKSVQILRSELPFDAPAMGKSTSSLTYATISDLTKNSFRDSSVVLNGSGKIYYRVLLNFSDRFIVSDLLEAGMNAFSVDLNLPNFVLTPQLLPECNLLILHSASTITVIDYKAEKLIGTIVFPSGSSYLNVKALVNNSKPEIYVSQASNLYCYDAYTLQQKFFTLMNPSVAIFFVRNDHVYYSNGMGNLYVYDVVSKSLVSTLTINHPPSNWEFNMYASPECAYVYQLNIIRKYPPGSNFIVYEKSLLAIHLVNDLPADTVTVSGPGSLMDTLTDADANFINLSPDGKYLVCHENTTLYNLVDHTIYQAQLTNAKCVFSSNSQLMFCRDMANYNSPKQPLHVYDLVSRQKKTDIVSPTSFMMTNLSSYDDFLDNDTLISYNLQTGASSYKVNVIKTKL